MPHGPSEVEWRADAQLARGGVDRYGAAEAAAKDREGERLAGVGVRGVERKPDGGAQRRVLGTESTRGCEGAKAGGRLPSTMETVTGAETHFGTGAAR